MSYSVVIYEQEWLDERRSYHRHPSDILEFARNQNPVPVRCGNHREVRISHPDLLKKVEDSRLGIWK